MREAFVLPNTRPLLIGNQGELCDKVVVISIIGKSGFNSYGLKTKSIGRIFSNVNENDECSIQGYYDEENQIVYLHVRSLLDADLFLKRYDVLVEKYRSEQNNDDFLLIYDEVKSSFARCLFLLFYISHIVVLSHPGSIFDISYVQYFKAVDSIRHNYHKSISDILQTVEGASLEWIGNWRLCTPRLIFYFETCPKNITNLKKLEHNIEDRIYQILRKTRIISVNNVTSLFSIPLNEEFVFVAVEKKTDRLGNAIRGLIQGCQPGAAVQMRAPFCGQPDSKHSFQQFLNSHIQQARNKRFEETITSRHALPQSTHFELPPLKQWALAAKKLFNLIMEEKTISSLSTDLMFSEQRCLKVLPIASARYQEGLPSHYTELVHETRLNAAVNLFGAQARGPVFQQYNEQLLADCRAFWQSGRQLCEAPSLTGNPCNLPKHTTEEHCSGVRYVAACDCGRKQGNRDDPYTAKQANHFFYQQLSKDCVCVTLERVKFHREELPKEENLEEEERTENIKTIEMLTMDSSGSLPSFPSWSLVCLGPSSLYSHNLGLSENYHPGFINSTNYLLPWDVAVYSKNKNGPTTNKATRGRRTRAANNLPLFSVKVFIGFEYECPRGHRFMLAGPDKVLRATPGSIVKDTGRKIAESDMPLYFPCPCRTGKQRVAQLMRLHVVTPKAPVHVALGPKVIPSANGPIFTCTPENPVNLSQSAYWVMRLPYVYMGEQHYAENNGARLLQGVFGVNKIE